MGRTTGRTTGRPRLRGRAGPLATAVCLVLVAGGLAAGLSRQELRGGNWHLLTGVEIWLLAVFVAAVLALLFGASAWLGVAFRGRGAREALEGLRARADEMDRRRSESAGPGGSGSPFETPTGAEGDGRAGRDGPAQGAGVSPAWIMEVGGWLTLLYVAGWLALG